MKMQSFPERDRAFERSDALIAQAVLARRAALGRPVVFDLSGAQGSGKSTTARRVASRLTDAGASVAVLSLDDFYLTRSERSALSRNVHGLLRTRGVPGTHDVGLLMRTLDAPLRDSGEVMVPTFDKSTDDHVPDDEWPRHRSPLDVVVLEGWCVGA